MRKLNGIVVGCVVGWAIQACSPTLSGPDDGEAGDSGTAVSRGGSQNGGGATGKYSASSAVAKGGSALTSSSSGSGVTEAAQGGAGNSASSSSSAGGNASEVSSSAVSGGSSAIESSKPGTGGSNMSGGSSASGAGGHNNVGAGGSSAVSAGGSSVVSAGGTSSVGGSSARGGTSSVGGSSASLRANGQVCQAASQCSSNNCVDGYCCNTACDGVCATCSATPGTCTKPATDPACVSIANASYPSDTTCTDYTLTTTGGECSQLGTCAVGYTSNDYASRTSCSSDGALCNGAGQCLRPKVSCGTGAFATTCDVGPGQCCRDWAPGSTASNLIPGVATCSNGTSDCPRAVGATLFPVTITCNDSSGCALGKVCCVHATSAARRTAYCGSISTCTVSGPNGGGMLACRGNSDCAATPATPTCTEDPGYPEVKVCK